MLDNIIYLNEISCAYNFIKKAAHSSTLIFLAEILNANRLANIDLSQYEEVKNHMLARRTPAREIDRIGTEFDIYLFTVVRNPYSRLLSAYIQKSNRLRMLGKEPTIPGFDRVSKEGFSEFISYLENGALRTSPYWIPQTELLHFRLSRCNRIARVESLSSDLSMIVSDLGLRWPASLDASSPHPLEVQTGRKVFSIGNKLSEFYDKKVAERVYLLYRNDFDAFSYEVTY
jgi:hypothetical protein